MKIKQDYLKDFPIVLVGSMQKEINNLKETKDKQIVELKQLSERSQQTRQHEYEKKVMILKTVHETKMFH